MIRVVRMEKHNIGSNCPSLRDGHFGMLGVHPRPREVPGVDDPFFGRFLQAYVVPLMWASIPPLPLSRQG